MCVQENLGVWVVCVWERYWQRGRHTSAHLPLSLHMSSSHLPCFNYFLSFFLSPSCSHVIIPFLCHPLCVTLNCLPSTATQIEFCTKFPLHLPRHSVIPALSCSLRTQTHTYRPFLFVINYLRYIHRAFAVWCEIACVWSFFHPFLQSHLYIYSLTLTW